jgi:hypothetical protein
MGSSASQVTRCIIAELASAVTAQYNVVCAVLHSKRVS